jgi:hypothetical protein
MAKSGKTYSHFVAKLSVEGGPDPATELQSLLDQARKAADAIAWFATWHVANDFDRAGDSICIIFHETGTTGAIQAVVAHIPNVVGILPAGKPLNSEALFLYANWRKQYDWNWWPLGGRLRPGVCPLVRTTFNSLNDIPGRHWESGLPASQVFTGQASFVGWQFDVVGPRLFEWLSELPGDRVDPA